MSTHNIGFYEEISKIITYHQISSNTHLISSAAMEYYTCSFYILRTAKIGVRCIFEPRCEKTGLRGFRPGPTQTGLYYHRR